VGHSGTRGTVVFFDFGHYFALVGKIDTNSLIYERSCTLCPNVENFCPNNGQFFSVGDATASPASPCRKLMTQNENITQHISPRKPTNFRRVEDLEL